MAEDARNTFSFIVVFPYRVECCSFDAGVQ